MIPQLILIDLDGIVEVTLTLYILSGASTKQQESIYVTPILAKFKHGGNYLHLVGAF